MNLIDRVADLYDRVHPNQKRSEYLWLAQRVRALLVEPKIVLEIGSERGGTLALWSELAADDALLISVDLAGPTAEVPVEQTTDDFLRARVLPSQRLTLVRANSHAPEARAAVLAALAGVEADMAFIDAGHTYEDVRADFRDYGLLVRAGGLVLFHDVHDHVDVKWNGVPRFMRDLAGNVPTVDTYVEHVNQLAMGVSCVQMSKPVRAFAESLY